MADPTATDPFVTAQQVVDYSKGKIQANDARLSDAITGASAAVRRYCGWHVWPQLTEVSLTLDGPGGRVLELPSMQVQDVRSITQHDVLLDPSMYDWSELGEVELCWGHWSHRYRSIVAVIDHGYDEVPDLCRVVLAMITRELSSPSGATREQAGQVAVSWAITSPGVSGGIAVMQPEYAVLDAFRIVGS